MPGEDIRFDPWWWEAAPPVSQGEAPLPATADVAIVGTGFTGLSAALTAARAGRSVAVLEAGEPGSGASTRNGGMVGSGHKAAYGQLSRRYGKQAALDFLGVGIAALEFTAGLIEREGIDCHFTRSGRFRVACRPAHYETMARETDLLSREIGLEAEMVPRAEQGREVATDAYHGGCLYPRHGSLHPALFHRGLLERAEGAGARVFARTPVTGMRRDGKRLALRTPRGTLTANDVIIATNGYTGGLTPGLRRRVIPIPSFIIATEELPPERIRALIPGGRMIVETRAAHCYYRASPDGRRLLFGGRAALHPIDLRLGAKRLHGLMSALFPQMAGAAVTHSWTGFVAYTRDRLPHLGTLDGVHYAMGYSGSGVAMAPYLGHKTALKALGSDAGRTPLDDARFAAFPLYSGRPWFLPLANLWFRAMDGLGY